MVQFSGGRSILRRTTYQVSDNNWMVYQIQRGSSAPWLRFVVNNTSIGDSDGYSYAGRAMGTVQMLADMDTYANQMPGAQLQFQTFMNNWIYIPEFGGWQYFAGGQLWGYHWPYWPFGWSTWGDNEFGVYDMACQW